MTRATIDRRQFLSALLPSTASAALVLPKRAAAGSAVRVWKDPDCGCCNQWIAHLRRYGFDVTVNDSGTEAARARAGIATRYGSCHTALVEGYAVEGHVPARDIQRLIKERPNAIGLAVPGMPNGSPGMEQGGRADPYSVLLLHKDGSSSVFASYPRGGGA